jgi:hypothetical protein
METSEIYWMDELLTQNYNMPELIKKRPEIPGL